MKYPVRAGVLFEGSVWEGFASEIIWLLAGFSVLRLLSQGLYSFAWRLTRGHFQLLATWTSQWGHVQHGSLLHQSQQGRASASKLEFTISCNHISYNLILEVLFHHLCCIDLKSVSKSAPTQGKAWIPGGGENLRLTESAARIISQILFIWEWCRHFQSCSDSNLRVNFDSGFFLCLPFFICFCTCVLVEIIENQVIVLAILPIFGKSFKLSGLQFLPI